MSVMIPEEVATLAGGPEPIGPPGEPPMGAPPGPDPGMMGGPPPGMGPEGGGLPPELAGMLGGGGPPEPPPGAGGGGSEVDILTEALNTLMEYLQVASDDIEKSKAMQAAKIVQDLLASNQKEQESAAGVGPAQKGMAKAIGAAGGGY